MPLDKKLGFLAAGQMAEALARGFIERGVISDPAKIYCYDVFQPRVQVFESFGVNGCSSNQEVVANSDIVFVCTKPQYVATVLQEVRKEVNSNKLFVSIAAGVPIATIQEAAGKDAHVIRVMPNTPCLVGETAAAMCLGSQATQEDAQAVQTLFEAVGSINTVDEKLLNAVTGLSGSGPAYGFVIIEALADGGVKAGLPRDIAQQLAAQTMLGAAKMVLQTGKHPGQLKDMVTSPAGTTIAGVAQLEEGGVRRAMINAVTHAAKRAEELSKT